MPLTVQKYMFFTSKLQKIINLKVISTTLKFSWFKYTFGFTESENYLLFKLKNMKEKTYIEYAGFSFT